MLGERGQIDPAHKLAAMWSNTCLMLDARDSNDPEEMSYDIVLLDYAAERIDDFSQGHMISGDESARAVLTQWLDRLWFVPDPAMEWAKNHRYMDRSTIGYRYWYPYTTRADGRRVGFNEHFIADDFGDLVMVKPP